MNDHAKPSPPPAGATVYTCPMHPQIRRPAPGNCPICGMALEPLLPTLDDDNPELADFSRRFWRTLPFTVAVTAIAMLGHRFAFKSPQAQSWIELALAAPIVLWGGWSSLVRGAQSFVNRSANMWTLIGLGVSVAFVYSLAATVAPQVFPAGFVVDGRIGVYYEAVAVIVSLTLLGQLLELKARGQTSAAIKSLLGLAPKTARRIRDDGTEEDVPLAHVHVGDRLRVRPTRAELGVRHAQRAVGPDHRVPLRTGARHTDVGLQRTRRSRRCRRPLSGVRARADADRRRPRDELVIGFGGWRRAPTSAQ